MASNHINRRGAAGGRALELKEEPQARHLDSARVGSHVRASGKSTAPWRCSRAADVERERGPPARGMRLLAAEPTKKHDEASNALQL